MANRARSSEEFEFRGMSKEDLVPVQRLHDELFPVKYAQSFFDRLVSNHNDIMTFGVTARMRRQGLATLLLKKLMAAMVQRKMYHFTLHVKSDNTAAISFYRKFGFRIIAFHDAFYEINGRPEDAYEMEFIFPPEAMKLGLQEADLERYYIPSDPSLDKKQSIMAPNSEISPTTLSALVLAVILFCVILYYFFPKQFGFETAKS